MKPKVNFLVLMSIADFGRSGVIVGVTLGILA
jgi:hypothetical protein